MKNRPTGDLQFVQQMNRKLVLETLINCAPVSRVQVARITTLSPTTVTNAVAALIDEGLVQEVGTGLSTVGRRPILLDVCWDSRSVIGLSVLDDRLIGVRTNIAAKVQSRVSLSLAPDEDLLLTCKAAIDALLLNHSSKAVLGIGVSIPGILDRPSGSVESSANFPWSQLALGADLYRYSGIPTVLENDTNAAALAERHFGSGQGVGSFAYVRVGTGIGAGLVVDGKLLLGTYGNAGEIGHMTVNWLGKECTCGSRGCLESYVSWNAVREMMLESSVPSLAREAGVQGEDRPAIVDLLYQNPEVGKRLVEAADILGTGIASLVTVTDPELVIVDGIYRQCERFMQRMKESTEARLSNVTKRIPRIVCGNLGDDAGALGAVAVVLGKHGLLHTEFRLERPAQRRTTKSALAPAISGLPRGN